MISEQLEHSSKTGKFPTQKIPHLNTLTKPKKRKTG